jgi:hypothetical protein
VEDVDATIFLSKPSTSTRRLDALGSRRARARARLDRLDVPSRVIAPGREKPARAHSPSHASNQQQGYWVTETYLLSCFAHFGAWFRFPAIHRS